MKYLIEILVFVFLYWFPLAVGILIGYYLSERFWGWFGNR